MIAIFYEWKCSDFTNGHFRILPLYLFLDLCFQCWYYIPITEQARTLCPCKGPFLDNIFDLRPSAFATLIVIMIEPMCSFQLVLNITKWKDYVFKLLWSSFMSLLLIPNLTLQEWPVFSILLIPTASFNLSRHLDICKNL